MSDRIAKGMFWTTPLAKTLIMIESKSTVKLLA